MHNSLRGKRRMWLAVTAAAVVAVATGCDLFDESGPERVRVLVMSGEEVRVVLSRDFVVVQGQGEGGQVELAQADTFQVLPPFDTAYSIAAEQRFFAEASWVEDTPAPETRMQVWVDGESRYDQQRVLDGDVVLRFVYSTRP